MAPLGLTISHMNKQHSETHHETHKHAQHVQEQMEADDIPKGVAAPAGDTTPTAPSSTPAEPPRVPVEPAEIIALLTDLQNTVGKHETGARCADMIKRLQ